jgi:hypothetical protein
VMYRETGMYPIQLTVLDRMLRFILRSITLKSHEYLKQALADNFDDYREHGTKNWTYCLFEFLNHIGFPTAHIHSFTYFSQHTIDRIKAKWRSHYQTKVWSNLPTDPRTAPSDNIKICTYHNWFAPPLPTGGQKWEPAHYILHPQLPYHQSISLAKFRTSSHHLLINALRGKTPRSARICPLCNQGVQDEHHIIFDCSAMNEARSRHRTLWRNQSKSLNALFNNREKSGRLASFVHLALQLTEPVTGS